jgi:hypothetical protein
MNSNPMRLPSARLLSIKSIPVLNTKNEVYEKCRVKIQTRKNSGDGNIYNKGKGF